MYGKRPRKGENGMKHGKAFVDKNERTKDLHDKGLALDVTTQPIRCARIAERHDQFKDTLVNSIAAVSQGIAGVVPDLPGVKLAKVKRFSKVNTLGVSKLAVHNFPEEYKSSIHHAEKFLKARLDEYRENFGQISVGVITLLANAALTLGLSRYLHDRAALEGDVQALIKIAGILDKYKNIEFGAYEMAAREAMMRKSREVVDTGLFEAEATVEAERSEAKTEEDK